MHTVVRFKSLLVFRRHVDSFAQVPYLFREAGIEVHAAGTDYTRSIRFSRNIAAFHLLPYEADRFAESLLQTLESLDFDFVIFVDEPALTAVYNSKQLNQFAPWLPFPIGSELVDCIGSKVGFQRFMERHGLATPKFLVAAGFASLREAVAGMGFPCVIKTTQSTSGHGVYLLKDAAEFESALEKLPHEGEYVVQEFIEGQTAAVTFLSFKGVLKSYLVATKSIALDGGKGPSIAARILDHEEAGSICREIARLGNLTGITGLDIMIDARGRAYGIDPHFGRMTTHIHFGQYGGIHFGHLLRECLEGDLSEKPPAKGGHALVKYPECISLAFQGGLPRLLREFPPFKKGTHYLICQPGETPLAFIQGLLAILSNLRCIAGAWKAGIRKWVQQKNAG